MIISMKRIWIAGASIALVAAVVFSHLYRCRTLDGRSDLILRGRMLKLSDDRKRVIVSPVNVYKGALRGRDRQALGVDIVWRWHCPDIMPPWPDFKTNKTAVFYLRRSLWSLSYEPLWIANSYRGKREEE